MTLTSLCIDSMRTFSTVLRSILLFGFVEKMALGLTRIPSFTRCPQSGIAVCARHWCRLWVSKSKSGRQCLAPWGSSSPGGGADAGIGHDKSGECDGKGQAITLSAGAGQGRLPWGSPATAERPRPAGPALQEVVRLRRREARRTELGFHSV